MKPLTPRQARFVQEYLVDLCGKEAAIRAHYAPRSAKVRACILLKTPHVAAAVQAAKDERARATNITAERVLDEIAVVAFSDLQNHIDDEGALKPKKFADMPGGTSRALEAMSEIHGPSGDRVSVKLHDKMKALDMLSHHLGICREQVDISGKVDGELVVKVVKV